MPSSSKEISSENSPWSKPFSETNLNLLEQEILSDVTFLAGHGETPVRAHRCLLASRSDVFYAMFCGPLAEKLEIRVPDIEPEILKMLLRYLYTEKCTLTNDSSTALLYAAKKYDVAGLVQECSDFLMDRIEADNVCTVLMELDFLDEIAIVERVLHYAIRHGEAVLKSEDFLSLNREMVKKLVESDYITANEELVYESCVRWAKHQCQQQQDVYVSDADVKECLGELLFFVRFPVMTLGTFRNSAAKDDILTSDEKVTVLERFEGGSEYRGKFPTKPRKRNIKSFVIERVDDIQPGRVDSYDCDAITFSLSEDVLLSGLSLFNVRVFGIAHCKLQVVKDDKTVILEDTIELKHDYYKKYIEIMFKPPVFLKQGTKYTLVHSVAGMFTYSREGERSTESKSGVDVTFYGGDESIKATNVDWGVFYQLHMEKFVH